MPANRAGRGRLVRASVIALGVVLGSGPGAFINVARGADNSASGGSGLMKSS